MGVFYRGIQPLFLVCVALAACHADASLSHAETPGHVPHLPSQNLRALGTSFSEKISNALTQSPGEHQGTTTTEDAAAAAAAPTDVFSKKPTMGDWFQKLIADMDKQYPGHGPDYNNYGREQHKQDYYKQEGPEQYYGHDMQQYERYYQQYKEQHSYRDGKAEELCMQEVARENCLVANSSTTTTSDDTLRFTEVSHRTP
jgi:hypothetical protein